MMPNATGVNELPDVGRIQGLMLIPAQTPRDSKVQLQYTDQKGQWHQTTMPFLDAMYLLSALKALHDDTGFRLPDDTHVPDDLVGNPSNRGTIAPNDLKLVDLTQPATVTRVPATKITTSPISDKQSRSFTTLSDAISFAMESLSEPDRLLTLIMTNRGLLRAPQIEELYKTRTSSK
jgi:hypothetical protein